MTQLRLEAPAKINLHLEVYGRDPAGYHLLETIFQTIDLADKLEISYFPQKNGTFLSCSEPTLSAGEDNLICKAIAAWRKLDPELGRIEVHLEKHIPAGGGLGGGSSDAASTLQALHRLRPQAVSNTELDVLARSLGADVAFFLYGGTAYADERGDHITPQVDLPSQDLWLITPPFGCSTPAVFKALNDAERMQKPIIGPQPLIKQIEQGDYFNRLTRAATEVSPALNAIIGQLEDQGCQWLLSGSGSSIVVFNQQPAGLPCRAVRFRPRSPAQQQFIDAGTNAN